MKNYLPKLALMVVALAALSAPTYAVPTLWITDTSTTIFVADGSAMDESVAAGVVTWSGSIGVWTINVSTGISNSPSPSIFLNSVDHSDSAGLLFIFFSDTGFVGSGSTEADVGGTLASNGVTQAQYWGGSSNSLFDLGQTLSLSSAFFNAGPLPTGFSESDFSSLTSGTPYSLTEGFILEHQQASTTSTNLALNVATPDGGTTALLVGAGMIGLGLVSLRGRRATA